MLHMLGRTHTPWLLNSEVGDLGGFTLVAGTAVQLRALRRAARPRLAEDANWALPIGLDEINAVAAMDNCDALPLACEIGTAAAAKFVKPEHLGLGLRSATTRASPDAGSRWRSRQCATSPSIASASDAARARRITRSGASPDERLAQRLERGRHPRRAHGRALEIADGADAEARRAEHRQARGHADQHRLPCGRASEMPAMPRPMSKATSASVAMNEIRPSAPSRPSIARIRSAVSS